MIITPLGGALDPPSYNEPREPQGRAHDRVCRAWLGEPCGCQKFIYQEDGAPLMRLGTEAPEDK